MQNVFRETARYDSMREHLPAESKLNDAGWILMCSVSSNKKPVLWHESFKKQNQKKKTNPQKKTTH